MALQEIGEQDNNDLIKVVQVINQEPTLYELRLLVAGLAHPQILDNEELCLIALQICAKTLEDILTYDATTLKSDAYKTLSKGLEYSISVFCVYQPQVGLSLLEKYATYNNKAINKIIKENLKKKRIQKYSAQLDKIAEHLT